MNERVKMHRRETPKLYEKFQRTGIHRCEWPKGCNSKIGLAAAHRLKRLFIKTVEEFHTAALLCSHHHDYCEMGDRKHKGTHRRNYRLITWIINRREHVEARNNNRPAKKLNTVPAGAY